MAGLLAYLQGPGKRDEHERPHVVAGDPGAVAVFGSGEPEEGLSRGSALELARYLEQPSRALGERVTQGVYERVEVGREVGGQRVLERRKTGERDAHVYQVALSARSEEGLLGDETWRAISERFVEQMGFTGSRDESDPGLRWAAIHHGVSVNGNDHIHLAINLVREDGSRVDVHRDFARAKEACRQLEDEFGLMPLHPNEYELARTYARTGHETTRRAAMQDPAATPAMPWAELSDDQQEDLVRAEFASPDDYRRAVVAQRRQAAPGTSEPMTHQASREAAGRTRARAVYQEQLDRGEASVPWAALSADTRTGLIAAATPAEEPSAALARTVRACATASRDEAEFVRRIRRQNVLVRPRFARGRTDVVEGYSVAERPARGERPIWRGGGRLGKDLALPRLRGQWEQSSSGPAESVQAAQDAVQEWSAVRDRKRPVNPGREQLEATPAEAWRHVEADVRELRERLRTVPLDDREAWSRVARQSAGVFAAWSVATEPEPGPLAATSKALARAAQTPQRDQSSGPAARHLPSASTTAYLLFAAAGTGPAAKLAVLKAFLDLSKALHDMHVARGEALRAQQLEQTVRGQLLQVVGDLSREAAQEAERGAEDLVKVAASGHETPTRPGPAGPGESEAQRAARLAGQGRDPRPAPGATRRGPQADSPPPRRGAPGTPDTGVER